LYTYNGYVCDHTTWEVYAEDSFPFEKLYSDDLSESGCGWGLYGWDVEENLAIKAPSEFELLDAYPNPFNPSATISFDLPVASEVKLDIYDINGRNVEALPPRPYSPGHHQMTFCGDELPSGIYFVRLSAGDFQETQKIVLMK